MNTHCTCEIDTIDEGVIWGWKPFPNEWNFYTEMSNIDPFNSSVPGQNGRHFTDGIFRCNFVNERFCILIKMLLKFVPKVSVDNNPALV